MRTAAISSTQKHRGIGFTLIELLVVIAIISLLVSILLPSLNRAKAMARTVVCLSNVKQIGLCCMFYADANNDTMPASCAVYTGDPNKTTEHYADGKVQNSWDYHWFKALSEYAGTKVEMVEDGSDYAFPALFWGCTEWAKWPAHNQWTPGYGMIIQIFDESGSAVPTVLAWNRYDYGNTDTPPHKFFKRSELKVPSSMIWLGPSSDWHIYGDPMQTVTGLSGGTTGYPVFMYWHTEASLLGAEPDRHGDVANYLYADGHAATVNKGTSGAGACFYSKVK